jgi:hypothetical protein
LSLSMPCSTRSSSAVFMICFVLRDAIVWLSFCVGNKKARLTWWPNGLWW